MAVITIKLTYDGAEKLDEENVHVYIGLKRQPIDSMKVEGMVCKNCGHPLGRYNIVGIDVLTHFGCVLTCQKDDKCNCFNPELA